MDQSVLNCIVIDDDRTAREMLKQCISITDTLCLTAEYESAIAAKQAADLENIDLVFLDVEMPMMTGIDFMQNFRDLPPIILVTSKKDYAFEGFENDAVDFIVKPIKYPRFLKAVEKAKLFKRRTQESLASEVADVERQHIFVKSDQDMKKVWVDEIIYLEAFGDYVRIYLENERVTVLTTLKGIFDQLPIERFMQVHRSYVVQIEKITRVEAGNTVILNDQSVPLSRSKKNELKERIMLYQSR